jgi:L-arabinonolactonase
MKCELVKVIPVINTLGECVLWNEISNEIIWTDIQNKKIYFYNMLSEKIRSYNLPERLCSFAMIRNSMSLLAAFETGLAILSFSNNVANITWLKKLLSENSGIRLNDGRVDNNGVFWFGAMIENVSLQKLSGLTPCLYSIDCSQSIKIHETNIGISNSISWNNDGSNMFFSDSLQHNIFIYDTQSNVSINNKRVFAQTPTSVYPDGSCVDIEDCLWNAQWGGGEIVRYSPKGKVLHRLNLPCPQPTCVTFGGEYLDLLIVSTATEGLIEKKNKSSIVNSGNILIYKTEVRGNKENRYLC